MYEKEENIDHKEVTKICGICGDKALGYNFNAITCESCKAFFRRNALRNKDFKCPFEGNCRVDLITRRFCQKCRLKKCFDIGMKKEWILSEEEKQVKRNKIAENRMKRQCVNKVAKVADSTTSISPNLIQMIQNRYNSEETTIGNSSPTISFKDSDSLPSDIEYNSFRKSNIELISSSSELNSETQNRSHLIPNKMPYSPKMSNSSNLNSICDSLNKNSIMSDYDESISSSSLSDSKSLLINVQKTDVNSASIRSMPNSTVIKNLEINEKISDKNTSNETIKPKTENIETENSSKVPEKNEIPDIVFQKTVEVEFATIPIRQNISEINPTNMELNELENKRLTELSIATTVLRDPLARITSETTGLVDAIKMTDQAIRRLIKMSKKINAFKSLCQHDQIALLKAGCTEIIILRSVISFNFEREYWAIVTDSNNATLVKLDILKQAKGNIYEAHKNFMLSFKQEWNTDEHILDLLTAILLFTPNRANTIHKDVIKLEQQTYIYLLQRYLESKYSSKCEAKTRYLKLMSKLEELHILNEEHVRIYLDIDPNDVGPLLIEIFDLKH